MSSRLDDLLALLGLISLLAGVYLWLGLAAVLILFGVILIYAGARIDTEKQHGPDQATHSPSR